MIVRYRERALLDIDELYKYIEERSPAGALNVLREVYGAWSS
jgi:plasmid stabilization system protein ParE